MFTVLCADGHKIGRIAAVIPLGFNDPEIVLL